MLYVQTIIQHFYKLLICLTSHWFSSRPIINITFLFINYNHSLYWHIVKFFYKKFITQKLNKWKCRKLNHLLCSYDNQPIALDCVAKHRRMNSKCQVFLDYTPLDWSGSPLLPPNASLTFTKLIYCPVLELCLLYLNKHFLKYWILPSTQREPSAFRVQ